MPLPLGTLLMGVSLGVVAMGGRTNADAAAIFPDLRRRTGVEPERSPGPRRRTGVIALVCAP